MQSFKYFSKIVVQIVTLNDSQIVGPTIEILSTLRILSCEKTCLTSLLIMSDAEIKLTSPLVLFAAEETLSSLLNASLLQESIGSLDELCKPL